MSCSKKEKKPMTPLKTLDIIFRRRYVRSTQYYFTNRKRSSVPESETLAGKALLPYRVPESDKLLSYIKYSDREKRCRAQKQPLHLNKNTAEIDFSRRLFIEEPPDDIKAVVAIHPEFYTSIEGRPLRMFDDIKVYINNIRNYAMNKQQIGYRRDLIMQIERNILEESQQYDEISKNLKNYGNHFQVFLIEDYDDTCTVVSQAERIYAELLAKQAECSKYSSHLTIIKNDIYKLDSAINILKTYRKFLMSVAPLMWRQKYDEFFEGSRSRDHILFDKNDLFEVMDIDRIVIEAKKELRKPYFVHMYFKHPQELMDLFRIMQLQSREYMIQRSKSREIYYSLLRRINQLKAVAIDNLEYVNYYIEHFQNELEREEYNKKYTKEKFYRILFNKFYEDIASIHSLRLQICVEYVYEQVIGKCEEGHQNFKDIMTVLENMYEDYNLRLDTLDFNEVNQARNEMFSQDLKTMKNAYNAERELKAFREMRKALSQAFAPPKEYTKQSNINIKRKLNKIGTTDSNDQPVTSKYNLGSKERNILRFFTEWCDDADPLSYLEQFYKYAKYEKSDTLTE